MRRPTERQSIVRFDSGQIENGAGNRIKKSRPKVYLNLTGPVLC